MLKLKKYQYKEITLKELEMLENFADLKEIDGPSNIADTIQYKAYDFVDEIDYWKYSRELNDYTSEAIKSGLVDLSEPFTGMEDAIIEGTYLYLSDILYKNLHTLTYNIALEYLRQSKELGKKLKDYIENNEEMVEDELEMAVDHITNNNQFEDIFEAVDELIRDFYYDMSA